MELTKESETEIIEQEIKQEIGDTIENARGLALRIKDDETRAGAVDFGSLIQGKINKVKAKREDIVPPLRRAYEKVRAFFDDALEPLEAAKRTLAQAVSAYDIQVERQRRLEQEDRERKAREEREAYERKKRAWEAEQQRIKDEEARKERERQAEERRQQEEHKRKIDEEEKARIRHAEEAEKQGNTHKIEPILEKATAIAPPAPIIAPQEAKEALPAPLPLPPPPPPAPAPVIVARRPDENVIARDTWKWEGADLRALAQAIVERRAPLEYICFNEGEIGKDVRKLKDEFKCDGIRTWKERSTTFKAAKEDA